MSTKLIRKSKTWNAAHDIGVKMKEISDCKFITVQEETTVIGAIPKRGFRKPNHTRWTIVITVANETITFQNYFLTKAVSSCIRWIEKGCKFKEVIE